VSGSIHRISVIKESCRNGPQLSSHDDDDDENTKAVPAELKLAARP